MLCKIVCNFKKKKIQPNKKLMNGKKGVQQWLKDPSAMLTESTFNENMKVSNIKQIWVKKEFY